MAKALVGFPRHTAEANFTSDNHFDAEYPVTNSGSLPFSKVARTPDTTGLCITATFAEKKRIELVVLSRHNIIVAEATRRIKIYDDDAGIQLLHDSGELPIWPATKTEEQVDWDGGQWWDRGYTVDEKSGYPFHSPYFVDGLLYAKRVDVCIEAGSHLGDIDIGLIEITAALQFPVNPSIGAKHGFLTRSEVIEADGGVEYFERKDKPRVFEGELPVVAYNDAQASFKEFQRQADIDTPFFWWPDRDDTLHSLRNSFMARNARLSLMSYVSHHYQSVPIHFKEWL